MKVLSLQVSDFRISMMDLFLKVIILSPNSALLFPSLAHLILPTPSPPPLHILLSPLLSSKKVSSPSLPLLNPFLQPRPLLLPLKTTRLHQLSSLKSLPSEHSLLTQNRHNKRTRRKPWSCMREYYGTRRRTEKEERGKGGEG